MAIDLNMLTLFMTVAGEGNFRAAADRLGVTRSAVSQGMRRLEDACGVALVSRTTRSVRLTESGERFRDALAGPLADVRRAVEELEGEASPRGTLRVAATSIAERFLSGPLIASFAALHPGLVIDVTVTDEEFDIVAAGFDAGVRLGEVIEQDMISVPLTGDQRQVAVATPGYLEAHGAPSHPRDLVHHRCIGWRPSTRAAPYRWEFEENGLAFDVAVEPQVTTNDMFVMLRTALAGGGITFGMEETFRRHIERGELVPLLEEYLPPFAGFFLYFPSRRHMTPKLRALVDHVGRFRREDPVDVVMG